MTDLHSKQERAEFRGYFGGPEKVVFQTHPLRHPPLSLLAQSFLPCFLPFFRGVGQGHLRERRPLIPVSSRFPGAVSEGTIMRFG